MAGSESFESHFVEHRGLVRLAIPARAIIDRCRVFRPLLTPEIGSIASWSRRIGPSRSLVGELNPAASNEGFLNSSMISKL